MRPSSSSAAMSLRMVAGDTPRLCRSTSALLPTGSLVAMKSEMMARRTSSLRSSTFIVGSLLPIQLAERSLMPVRVIRMHRSSTRR